MQLDEPAVEAEVDVLVAGLGPGGCAAALAARAQGLTTWAVEARGTEATRSRLVLVRPGAQEVLRQIGLPNVTLGRRASTIRHIEQSLRDALQAAAADGAGCSARSGLSLSWHTQIVGLDVQAAHVRVTLLDTRTGQSHRVQARHVVDATGGRLEHLGRQQRERTGPSHIVATAEYETPPWFDGIVGVRDTATREALVLVPMRGRGSVTAYLDAAPGDDTDAQMLVQRFEATARQLALGTPRETVLAVDVVQRLLPRPSRDRVVPIGDSVGTVDLWLGAGMSTAIEDALDAARGIAAAQREARNAAEMRRTRSTSARILARHRWRTRAGQVMLVVRPLLVRLWPAGRLEAVGRDSVGVTRLLWSVMRLVAGRRPQTGG